MKKLLFIFLGTITFQFSNAQAPFNTPDNIGSGNCLDFDGTNDYVNIPHDANLNITGDITIEAWVKPRTITNVHYQSIISKRTWGVASLWSMWIISGNKLIWYSADCCPANTMESLINLNTVSAIPVGEWTHLAITVSGTTATGFVNGIQGGTGTINHRGTNTADVTIGKSSGRVDATTEPFDGKIEELRVWNRALSQSEIRDNMCKKLVGNETGLVGYWNMNEGTGSTVTDLTSNGNDGTLQ